MCSGRRAGTTQENAQAGSAAEKAEGLPVLNRTESRPSTWKDFALFAIVSEHITSLSFALVCSWAFKRFIPDAKAIRKHLATTQD